MSRYKFTGYIKIFFVFFFVINGEVFARNSVSQIAWSGASIGAMVATSVIILVGLLLLIFFYIRSQQQRKQSNDAFLYKLFNVEVDRLGLTKNEVKKIKELLRYVPQLKPVVILQSVSVFEKCVDLEIKRLLSGSATSKEIEMGNSIISSIRKKTGFRHLPFEHPLVSTRNITIGQTGAIFGKNHSVPIIPKATVEDTNEISFTLHYNTKKSDVFDISPNTDIKYAFSRQNDGLYGVILKVIKADSSGKIEVKHTINLKRNQLREFVRMDARLPLKFRLLRTTNANSSEVKRGQVVNAKMSDISGGGFSFICEQKLKSGDFISVTFTLPTGTFSGVGSRVLRVNVQEGKTTTYYKHHCKFENLEIRRRDAVVKYVFEKQRQANQWR